jgi:hypothetical protein
VESLSPRSTHPAGKLSPAEVDDPSGDEPLSGDPSPAPRSTDDPESSLEQGRSRSEGSSDASSSLGDGAGVETTADEGRRAILLAELHELEVMSD